MVKRRSTRLDPEEQQMSKLLISARFDVHAGKLDEFQSIMATAIRKVSDNEPRTLQYDWYHSDDHSRYVVLERYEDSDALLEHLANVSEELGAILEVADLKVDVFGTPSAELVEATAAIPIRVYTFHGGL
jgi:quinol monooxygenase YgiN